jgi:hypothetical protein
MATVKSETVGFCETGRKNCEVNAVLYQALREHPISVVASYVDPGPPCVKEQLGVSSSDAQEGEVAEPWLKRFHQLNEFREAFTGYRFSYKGNALGRPGGGSR